VRTASWLAEPASEEMLKKASARKRSAVLKLPTLLLTRSWPRRYAMSNCNVTLRRQTAAAAGVGMSWPEVAEGHGTCEAHAFATCRLEERHAALRAAGCAGPTLRHHATCSIDDTVLLTYRHACWITAGSRPPGSAR
jgi:hypothetical protein